MNKKDPKSVADFVPLTNWRVSKLGVGIVCISVPDAVSHVDAGDKATFQLRYFSDYDSPTNQSFFACADITYVDPSDIPYQFPCVNTTEPEIDPMPVDPTSTMPPEEPEPTGAEWSAGKRPSFTKGVIACIATLSGIALAGIVVSLWTLFRKRRERRLAAERQQEEAEWESQRVVTYGDYGLQDMSHVLPQQGPASEHANRKKRF